jgi:hypothetical protein
MKKIISIPQNKSLLLDIKPDAKLEIHTAAGGESYAEVLYETDNIVFETNNDRENFECRITHYTNSDQVRESFNKLTENFPFLNILKSINLSGNLPYVGTPILIDLYLNNTQLVKLTMGNGKLISEELKQENFSLEGNNLSIRLGEKVLLKNASINFNNGKLKMHLKNGIDKIKIDSNNTKIRLTRHEEFKGKISSKGNNTQVTGKADGNKEEGFVKISTNNSKIEIQSPELIEI